MLAGQNVFKAGHLRKKPDVLEGPGNPLVDDAVGLVPGDILPVKPDPALIGTVNPGHDIKNRCLARSVGADEAGDLAAAHGQVQPGDGGESAEAQGQALGL